MGVCLHIYIHGCICTGAYTWVHRCIHMHGCICMSALVHMRTYICMGACAPGQRASERRTPSVSCAMTMKAYAWVHMHECTCHAWVHMHACIYACALVHMHMGALVHMHACIIAWGACAPGQGSSERRSLSVPARMRKAYAWVHVCICMGAYIWVHMHGCMGA